MSAVLY